MKDFPLLHRLNGSRNWVLTRNRSALLTSSLVGKTVAVYNGQRYYAVPVTSAMVGHKVGEFVVTKKLGPSIHLSARNRKKAAKLRLGVKKK